MSASFTEVNFDGLVGPTYNYAGLSFGNLASTRHKHAVSNPKAAALQGLEKIEWVASQGLSQAILPPQPRPDFGFLRSLGFTGSTTRVIEAAWREDPILLAACYSASCMWTANAATVSPSPDCNDGRLHLTPANLLSGLHRSLEPTHTHRTFNAIFSDDEHFHIHPPLPSAAHLSDEGAANHTRLCGEFADRGLEFFVYGRDAYRAEVDRSPTQFPARQTLQASRAVARLHRLNPESTVFGQQSREAIDAGVFHNDVIAVGHRNVLLFHEAAFEDSEELINTLRSRYETLTGSPLCLIEISGDELSLDQAVSTYLFNSQLISSPENADSFTLLCPSECEEHQAAKACIERIIQEENPIDAVQFRNLRQSMNNGGGPACLRLRVVMSPAQQRAIHQGVLVTEPLLEQLEAWINKHYREELTIDDLRDPRLAEESNDALSELSTILQWPPGFLVG